MYLPKGFRFSGMHCGIKAEKKDLGLLLCDKPYDAVSFFTDNSFKAAPLLVSADALEESNHTIEAIVVNSGNSNCSTGEQGIADALAICNETSCLLETDGYYVHSSSTGIIGKQMPIKKIVAAIPELVSAAQDNEKSFNDFAAAIMTTDLIEKKVSKRFKVGKEFVTITGVAKGSGMIQPQMSLHATMLAYIVTDVKMSKALFKSVSKAAIESSFNSITVDGCMSTNDTVFCLKSDMAGEKLDKKHKDFEKFEKAMAQVAYELAKLIVKDGEGATKFIEVNVIGAKNQADAKKGAMAIANSMLVKTAMYGENPNIGRITQILGQVGLVDSTWVPKIKLKGLNTENVTLTVDISAGKAKWMVMTCDLTEGYIKINAEYN